MTAALAPPPPRVTSHSRLGDEALASRAARGCDDAFTALYERYYGPLLGYTRSILRNPEDASDATQNALENALRALPSREPDRPLRPWLYKIAHNEAISIMRRRKPQSELHPELEPTVPGPEVALEHRGRLAELVDDLQALPDRQRGALVMRELNGLSYDEISAALGLSSEAARRAVFDARTALHAAAAGHATECTSVRRSLSDGDRRGLRLCGVDRVFTMGGAQAVAALAYGTGTVPRVDKIVGPGNAYVAMAKRLVFGAVGIDMIAGPSEVVVVCDGETPPDWVAMDLFAQAEHDEEARAILITPDAGFLPKVQAAIDELLPQMPRAGIIRKALASRGAFIHVRDLDEAVALVNRLAPEHLELSVADPRALLPGIRHAGAIFLGRYAAEALGDYCAGPNHVLPTATTARFSSPLGVYDFQKRSSLIGCSAEGAARLAPVAAELARGESLHAHARSAEMRARSGKNG